MPKVIRVAKKSDVAKKSAFDIAMEAEAVELPAKKRSGTSAFEIAHPIIKGDTKAIYFEREAAAAVINCARVLKAYYVSGGTEGVDAVISASLRVLLSARVAKKIAS